MKFNIKNIPNIAANPINYAIGGLIFALLSFYIVKPYFLNDPPLLILITYVLILTGFGAIIGFIGGLSKKSIVVKTLSYAIFGFILAISLSIPFNFLKVFIIDFFVPFFIGLGALMGALIELKQGLPKKSIVVKTLSYAIFGFIFAFVLLFIVEPHLKGDITMAPLLLIIYLPILIGFGAIIGFIGGLSKKSIVVKTLSYAIFGFIFAISLSFIPFNGMNIFAIEIYVPFFIGLGALIGALIELKKGLQKENEVRGKDEAIEKRQTKITEVISKISIMELPIFLKANVQKIVMTIIIIFCLYFLSIVYFNERISISGHTQETLKTITNSIGMEFVQIPAGEFEMGSHVWEKGRRDTEGPVHMVKISQSFYLGKYEVTQKQWRDVMGNNPSSFKGDKLPVENISWNDVQDFINKLNEKEGVIKYRLPPEAEWEYAARAGTTTRYSFGNDESKLGDYAWYDDNDDQKTHDVGKKISNPWGLYDMHCNVWEWVQDKWHKNYDGAPNDGSAWETGSNSTRVIRSCSWWYPSDTCRSACRTMYPVGDHIEVNGFRLLRNL